MHARRVRSQGGAQVAVPRVRRAAGAVFGDVSRPQKVFVLQHPLLFAFAFAAMASSPFASMTVAAVRVEHDSNNEVEFFADGVEFGFDGVKSPAKVEDAVFDSEPFVFIAEALFGPTDGSVDLFVVPVEVSLCLRLLIFGHR